MLGMINASHGHPSPYQNNESSLGTSSSHRRPFSNSLGSSGSNRRGYNKRDSLGSSSNRRSHRNAYTNSDSLGTSSSHRRQYNSNNNNIKRYNNCNDRDMVHSLRSAGRSVIPSDDASAADQSVTDFSASTGMKSGEDIDAYRSKFKILLKRSRDKAKESTMKVEKLNKQLNATNAKLETVLDELTEVKYNSAQYVQKIAQLSVELADSKAKTEELNEQLEFEKRVNKSKATSFGAQAVKLSLELAKSKAETEKLFDQLQVERHNHIANQEQANADFDKKRKDEEPIDIKKRWFGFKKSRGSKTLHHAQQPLKEDNFHENENQSVAESIGNVSSADTESRHRRGMVNGSSYDGTSLFTIEKLYEEIESLEKENVEYATKIEKLEAKVEEHTQENLSMNIQVETLTWKLNEYTSNNCHNGDDDDSEDRSTTHNYLSSYKNGSKRGSSSSKESDEGNDEVFLNRSGHGRSSGGSRGMDLLGGSGRLGRSGSGRGKDLLGGSGRTGSSHSSRSMYDKASGNKASDDGDDQVFLSNRSSRSRSGTLRRIDILGGSGRSNRSNRSATRGLYGNHQHSEIDDDEKSAIFDDEISLTI